MPASIPDPSLQEHPGLRAPLAFAALVLCGFGLLYSLAGTALDGWLFPARATGSLLVHGGRAVGSALLAQPASDPRYFQPRPSAASYDPMAASGSNLARSNPVLQARIAGTRLQVARRDGVALAVVPAELVTASGSGLDPDISPAGAHAQVARVARARALDPAVVQALVDATVEPPQFGLLGQPRVNVLRLNLALDARSR